MQCTTTVLLLVVLIFKNVFLITSRTSRYLYLSLIQLNHLLHVLAIYYTGLNILLIANENDV